MDASKDHLDCDTAELVLRARRRDADAFAVLIRRYERVALSVAFSVFSDADAAGDIVQDAFIRAWERLAELKEPGSFATWLCGITRNLAIDQRRRRKHLMLSTDASSMEQVALGGDPADELDRDENQKLVAAALESLDEVTRPAVILRYYDGLSSKEIGQILGVSPAAVDMRLSRARQQLKTLLAPLHEPV